MDNGTSTQQSDSPAARSAPWFALVIAALGVVMLFFELGRMDIVSANEGQRATPPLEMLQSGDYMVPTINGETYLKKPPLLYWMIAAVYRATGAVTPLTARLPVALSGLALALALYFFVRRHASETVARWAGCMVLVSPYLLERMRLAQIDVPLGLAVFAAILALKASMDSGRIGRATVFTVLAGLATGAAIMLKAPAIVPFLGAAWGVQIILNGHEPERAVRTGLKWSVIALALTFALQIISLPLLMYMPPPDPMTGIPQPWEGASGTLFRLFNYPYGLAMAGLVWAWFVWRAQPGRRIGHVARLAAVLAIGAALTAPWLLAVVARKGMPFIMETIRVEFVDRTHTATPINSGTALYYLLAMPVLLAPWGFLLPLQASPGEWRSRPLLYRYACLTGWLGVLAFSLVAGKEYEYVLPAMPFLLVPAAFHVTAFQQNTATGWVRAYLHWWSRILAGLFVVAGLGGAVYFTLEQRFPMLLAFGWGSAVALAVLGAVFWKRPRWRPRLVLAMAALVLLGVTLSRAYHYTGERSPRAIATRLGELKRGGHAVEAFRIYPAVAFYARTPIPVTIDPAHIRTQLESDTPYYYLVREDLYEEAGQTATGLAQILMGPHTNKDLLLIGNAPLPEGG